MKALNVYEYDELSEDVQRIVLSRVVNSYAFNLDLTEALADFVDEEINNLSGGFLTNEYKFVINDVEGLIDLIYQPNEGMLFQLNCACAWGHLHSVTIKNFLTDVHVEVSLDNVNLHALIDDFTEDIKTWINDIKKEIEHKKSQFIVDYKSRSCVETYIDRMDMQFTENGDEIKIG